MSLAQQAATFSATRPARIAHRAGNDAAALERALAAGVDWIEVDLWWHLGRLICSHDQPLWPLPVTCGDWRPRMTPRPLLSLQDLLAATATGPQLLIDFKGGGRRLAAAAVDTLRRHGAVQRAAICGQDWPLLEFAAQLEPHLRVVHSFGSLDHLAAMRRRRAAPPISAASVSHRLLTPEVAAEFQSRGAAIAAWTVNESPRARELLDLGVAAIISDRLDLLAAIAR